MKPDPKAPLPVQVVQALISAALTACMMPLVMVAWGVFVLFFGSIEIYRLWRK